VACPTPTYLLRIILNPHPHGASLCFLSPASSWRVHSRACLVQIGLHPKASLSYECDDGGAFALDLSYPSLLQSHLFAQLSITHFTHFDMSVYQLPKVTGSSTRTINILLINPNGTSLMTDGCLRSLEPTLPPYCTVTGFTTPHPTPSAIEGHLDGVLSAAAAIRAVVPIASEYDAFLVACFSAHPLINALREELDGPVIGIMEAALYSARMLGGRLGIVATGRRSKIMHEDAIRYYGLEGFSVGCETTNLAVLELETAPKDKVLGLVGEAARRLVQELGADCIALGCAGMTEMKLKCEEAVGAKDATAQVIDGVGVGVQILIGLVREGHVTAKGGIFSSSSAGRKSRGQEWL